MNERLHERLHGFRLRAGLAILAAAGLAGCGGDDSVGALPAAGGDSGARTAAVRPKLAAFVPSATVAQPYAAGNITLPAGIGLVGDRPWIADHFSGFCALGDKPDAAGQYAQLDTARCVSGPVSPGQPVVQANDDGSYFVYVPDNSSKGAAIWRYRFGADGRPDPRYLPFALQPAVAGAPGFYNDAPRVTAIALSPGDGSLLAVYGRDRRVVKILNPSGYRLDAQGRPRVGTFENPGPAAETSAFIVGRAVDAVGPASITMVDNDLYLAEALGVTVLRGVGAAGFPAPAAPYPIATSLYPQINVPAPTAVHAPVALGPTEPRRLFVSDAFNVYRFSFNAPADPAPCANGGRLEILARGGSAGHDFRTVNALGSVRVPVRDTAGNVIDPSPLALYVADDETLGEVENDGRVFRALDAMSPAVGDRLATSCADQAEPVPPPVLQGNAVGRLFLAGNNAAAGITPTHVGNTTSPGGLMPISLGRDKQYLWVADHLLGVCRADKMRTAADRAAYCVLAGASPGGMAYDKARRFLYVADSSSNTGSVVRFSVNDDGTLGAQAGGVGSTLRFTHNTIRNNGPASVAFDRRTGTLYVAFKRNDAIMKLVNPADVPASNGTSTTAPVAYGRAAFGKGPFSMAFAGSVLYLAEPKGLTQINTRACASGCRAATNPSIGVAAPTYVTSDDVARTRADGQTVFQVHIATAEGVRRYTAPQRADLVGSTELFMGSGYGAQPDTQVPLRAVGAIGVPIEQNEDRGAGKVYVSDDPTDGANNGARVWLADPSNP